MENVSLGPFSLVVLLIHMHQKWSLNSKHGGELTLSGGAQSKEWVREKASKQLNKPVCNYKLLYGLQGK